MKLSPLLLTLSLLITAIAGTSCSGNDRPKKLNAAIDTLDFLLATRNDTLDARLAKAGEISRRSAVSPSVDNYLLAAQAFDGIDNDSAIVYTNHAINLATDSGHTRQARLIAIDFARRLAKSSLLRPAINILNRVTVDSLDRAGKARYYGVKSGMLIDAANAQTLVYLRYRYKFAAINALDTLHSLVEPESNTGHIIAAQINHLRGKSSLAAGELNEVFDNISDTDPMYPVACGLMASLYKDRHGKENEYLYYLALASIADARNANAEAASLVDLGTEFFKEGDLDRAYDYLSASGEYVVRSNSKKLYPQIAPTMSVLVEAMRAREAKRTAWLTVLIVALAVMVIACAVMLWHFIRKNSQRRAQNNRLNRSISSRDLYIKQLLDLCSVYVDGLEEFNRLVSRKLKVNQTQDLYKMIESGKMMQDQTDKFFGVFDNAINNIYPDFITELNTLLLPDKQVSAAPGGKLTPELRIVAFMRLGVTDSTRLSKFLGLSLNTVYTYRNRMKSRAKNRDTFELDINKIGSKA